MLFFLQTLTVYTFMCLNNSQMFRGFEGQKDPRYEDFYGTPLIRFPLVFTLVCYGVACYNAVATLETILSMLLGKLHIFMVGGMCYGSLSVQ